MMFRLQACTFCTFPMPIRNFVGLGKFKFRLEVHLRLKFGQAHKTLCCVVSRLAKETFIY
jgi:hypothetical protein